MNMKSFAALLLTTAIAVPASAQEDNLGSLQRMQQLELQQLQQFALPQETKTRDQLAIYAMGTSINSKMLKGTEMKTTTYGAVINYLYH